MLSVVTILLAMFGFLKDPVFAQDYIKIGVYLPMTGGDAAYGKMEWQGIQSGDRRLTVAALRLRPDGVLNANQIIRPVKCGAYA